MAPIIPLNPRKKSMERDGGMSEREGWIDLRGYWKIKYWRNGVRGDDGCEPHFILRGNFKSTAVQLYLEFISGNI